MRKRGISHIEVILAFVIFVTAVGFGLYFFNTGDSDRLVETVLAYSFREIEQNTSTRVESYSVKIYGSLIEQNPIALAFPGVEGKTRVENYDGEVLISYKSGDYVYVWSENWNNEDFVFVMFGEEFAESNAGTAVHNESYYEIGSSEEKNVISEKRFKELKEFYDSDYTELKSQENFNLPDRADFGFALVFSESEAITAEREIPDGFEVFSDSRRVSVLRETGDIVFADLVVKVW